MAKRKDILPIASMEKLIKKASNGKRVSEESKIALKDALEDIGLDIATKASKFASHAGRVTIKSGDIKLALRNTGNFK